IFGNGLLVSEGEFWRRQRRIAAPAFHLRRVAAMTESMAACTQARLAQWRGISGPLDICAEMMSLTLDIVTRTMFSTDIAPEVESVRRLMNTGMPRPTVLDILGLPAWLPRLRPTRERRSVADIQALVSRIVAARRATAGDRGDFVSLLL